MAVVRAPEGVWVGWHGGSAFFQEEKRDAARGIEDDTVRAPMTGRVVKVVVASGDEVKEDDVLVVLEAMKMEYRLGAPHGGKVQAVHCAEGELVDLGKTLVTLAR